MLWADSLRKSHDGQRVLFDELTFTVRYAPATSFGLTPQISNVGGCILLSPPPTCVSSLAERPMLGLGTVGRVDAVRAWLWSSDAIYILTATSGHAHSRGDRIAVVGANGCGKSSLLRLLAGSDQSDAGTMQLRKGLNVSYLAQDVDVEGDVTVLEMVLAADSGPAKAVREYEAAEASGDSDSLIDAMSR